MGYKLLHQHYETIGRLAETVGLLQWDMSTVMPKGSAAGRIEQLATLTRIIHDLRTDPRIPEWLDDASQTELDSWSQANLREIKAEYLRLSALPTDLVESMSRARSQCQVIWQEARPANDFERLKAPLETVLEGVREKAAILSKVLDVSPYEALMDAYEPGARTERIDRLFDTLESFLPNLLERVLERQAQDGPIIYPDGPFSEQSQKALGLRVMKEMGFEFDHGRLDVSAHPFCGGNPDDVRITTRYSETDFTQSLMGIIHETGHALYERGLPEAWRGQPVGSALGMGIHESQSLLMEMQAGRSAEFMRYLAPSIAQTFGGEGPAWSAENLCRLYTRVERGLIRVDADEVTYPLHVILRYRLERALLSGDLQIADLPGAWREGMKTLIGIEPETDTNGCMQDIHWHMGGFGYFPTYTLGAMNAAQLFDAAVSAHPEIPNALGRGDFSQLLLWLRENIHQQASRYDIDTLMTRATGRPLDVDCFRTHLENRYLGTSA